MAFPRYEATNFKWSVIVPLLRNKPRGVPRAGDRKIINGIFWRLRTGSPWADIPERHGPPTTVLCDKPKVVSWVGRTGYDEAHEEGISRPRQARRASPHDPLIWLCLDGMGDFQLFLREFQAALETYRRVMLLRPRFFPSHLFSAAAVAYLGRSHEAHDALESAQAQFAEQIDRRRHRPSWARPQDRAIKTDGPRLAAAGPE